MADNDDPVLGDMIEEDEINQINREVIVMVQGGDDGGDDMWYKGRLTNDKTELVVSHIWENGDWQQSDGQIPFGHIAAFYDLPAGLPAQVGGVVSLDGRIGRRPCVIVENQSVTIKSLDVIVITKSFSQTSLSQLLHHSAELFSTMLALLATSRQSTYSASLLALGTECIIIVLDLHSLIMSEVQRSKP